MISHKRDQMTDRLNDAADAVKQAWSGARERGADVIDAAKDTVDSARDKMESAHDSLADQLETTAKALRRYSEKGPIARAARARPLPTVMVAFAAGAVLGLLGSVLLSAMRED